MRRRKLPDKVHKKEEKVEDDKVRSEWSVAQGQFVAQRLSRGSNERSSCRKTSI